MRKTKKKRERENDRHSTLRTDMESAGSRISAVHAVDAVLALGLTCVTSVLLVRMLNAPYTIGFIHELVHANMNSACCTIGSTILADCWSVQYLRTENKPKQKTVVRPCVKKIPFRTIILKTTNLIYIKKWKYLHKKQLCFIEFELGQRRASGVF